MTPAGADAARFAADLIRIDTTNRGGGDARERPAAEYVAARLTEAGLEPVLLEDIVHLAVFKPVSDTAGMSLCGSLASVCDTNLIQVLHKIAVTACE